MAEERGGSEATTAVAVVIAIVIAVVLGVVVFNSGDDPAPPPPPPAAAPAPKPAANVSPLTGEPGVGSAVLAVKVDNSPQGRPWTGVADADVVYVEPVEGGVTRLHKTSNGAPADMWT